MCLLLQVKGSCLDCVTSQVIKSNFPAETTCAQAVGAEADSQGLLSIRRWDKELSTVQEEHLTHLQGPVMYLPSSPAHYHCPQAWGSSLLS